MKILIIEDELLIQKALKKLLEAQGVQVIATAQGDQALELIKDNDFDRIICDLMLHDITGFDIIEECKKKYKYTEISHKFMLMTAYSSETVLNKAREYGCPVFTKPFSNIHETVNLFISGANCEAQ